MSEQMTEWRNPDTWSWAGFNLRMTVLLLFSVNGKGTKKLQLFTVLSLGKREKGVQSQLNSKMAA